MTKPEELKFECASSNDVIPTCHAFFAALPPELGERFNAIAKEYVISYLTEGLYERLNGRTIVEIISEFEQNGGGLKRNVVASGERDGIRYTLYEAPDETDLK